jgi:periodic tryptophan protein 2
MLLKKYQISQNKSLDGIMDFLNSKNMTEAGPLGLIDDPPSDEEKYYKQLSKLSL